MAQSWEIMLHPNCVVTTGGVLEWYMGCTYVLVRSVEGYGIRVRPGRGTGGGMTTVPL